MMEGAKRSATGKQNARKRWDREKEKTDPLREKLRTWFRHYCLGDPNKHYGQVVSIAMRKFDLSRNTVKKYREDLSF